MKRTIRKIGSVLAICAALTVLTHTTHNDASHSINSAHKCVLCHTISIDSPVPQISDSPEFIVSSLVSSEKEIIVIENLLSTSSPRAPPIA